MENYPAPAQHLVTAMKNAAASHTARSVAFQGAPGANSHLATLQYFAEPLPLPCFGFEDAIDAVKDGQASFAMIPIENSLHGRVADIHFLLPESGLVIVGEHFLRIRHSLMGLAGADITEVMSHPQALGQCRKWLRANGKKPIAYADTAGAAALVAEMGRSNVGALAPTLAAELYGLDVIAPDVSDSDDNTTRFVILARDAVQIGQHEGPVMTTLVFEVQSVPSALYKALGGFATNGVNITKLESYQRGASFSATEFYMDIEGHPQDAPVARALAELEFHTKWKRLLGTYKQARARITAD